MEQFNQILEKYNCPRRRVEAKTTIAQIEDIVHFQLPDDYKFFIKNYLDFDGFIGQHYVQLWNFDELIEMNEGYLIFDNLPKTLGIGGNGNSEFIALEQIEDGNLRVVLSPFIDLDRQYHIEIGTSFSNFWERLDKGLEWFK